MADVADRRLSGPQLVRLAAQAFGPARSRAPLRELADAVGLRVYADAVLPLGATALVVGDVLLCRPADDDALTRCVAHGVACVVLLGRGRAFALGDVAALAALLTDE